MKIPQKDIEKIAELAKIDLSEAEKDKLCKSLAEITELFETIRELNITKDSYECGFCSLRSDNVENTEEEGTIFFVPRIVG